MNTQICSWLLLFRNLNLYSLIALHTCDSSPHILLRPRKVSRTRKPFFMNTQICSWLLLFRNLNLYSLIALHTCDSSPHILLRPRKVSRTRKPFFGDFPFQTWQPVLPYAKSYSLKPRLYLFSHSIVKSLLPYHTSFKKARVVFLKTMYEQTASKFRFKPRRLRGHQKSGICHRKKFLHTCRIHRKGNAFFVLIYKSFQLL